MRLATKEEVSDFLHDAEEIPNCLEIKCSCGEEIKIKSKGDVLQTAVYKGWLEKHISCKGESVLFKPKARFGPPFIFLD